MPFLAGALAAMFCALGLATIPMLRDQGPVDRLRGGAAAPERRDRSSITLRLVKWLGRPLRPPPPPPPPRLAPGLRMNRRATLEHRLDYAGRPGGMTVQRFVGLKGAMVVVLGLGIGGFLTLLGSSPLFILILGGAGWFAPDVWLSRVGRLRQEAIERTLPDFLDILAVSVRAGLGYRYA